MLGLQKKSTLCYTELQINPLSSLDILKPHFPPTKSIMRTFQTVIQVLDQTNNKQSCPAALMCSNLPFSIFDGTRKRLLNYWIT